MTYVKTLTVDCQKCDECVATEDNKFQCNWGINKKKKIMIPPKGKKPIHCKLKR